MKFPKLRHAGLCNILIFLPALFLFFAIGFNIPLANWGTPKWVLALNFLLGCAVSLGYLILGAFPLLCADQFFFLLREWKQKENIDFSLYGTPLEQARRGDGGHLCLLSQPRLRGHAVLFRRRLADCGLLRAASGCGHTAALQGKGPAHPRARTGAAAILSDAESRPPRAEDDRAGPHRAGRYAG